MSSKREGNVLVLQCKDTCMLQLLLPNIGLLSMQSEKLSSLKAASMHFQHPFCSIDIPRCMIVHNIREKYIL